MSNENESPSTEGKDESGLMIFLRVVGLLLVGPALVLYLISMLVS